MLNTVPPGWSPDQLSALNNLAALRDAYLVVKDVTAIGGPNGGTDTSPEAAQVKADIIAAARATWATVKTYPTP